jgi:transcription elongation GreA/GreB family factor
MVDGRRKTVDGTRWTVDGRRSTVNLICMPEKIILSTVSAWELGEKFETTVASKNEALREAKIAKLDGDLSENAPYQAAKEKFRTMGRIQRRLTHEMNHLIAQGHIVVDPLSWVRSDPAQKVEIGTVVAINESGENMILLIAGARDHHLPSQGDVIPIPYNSPLGRALEGHQADDEFAVDLNGRTQQITVKNIRRPTEDEIYDIFPALRKG